MHFSSVIFGFPLSDMPIQVVLTFIMGSGLYVIRRVSGTLILPMVLHGLWDSSLFLNIAVGNEPPAVQFLIYPLALVCAVYVGIKSRGVRLQS